MPVSRSFAPARNWNTGRTTKRPAATTATTAPITNTPDNHAGRPLSEVTSVTVWTVDAPSIGNTARIAITEMSWNSSTEKLAWPPDVLSRPRSERLDSTIAVDDIANVSPTAIADFSATPTSSAPLPTTTAV